MVSRDKILEVLKNKGVNLNNVATDPRVFERACGVAYNALPIPWRWFVGKKRVRKIISRLREQIPQK